MTARACHIQAVSLNEEAAGNLRSDSLGAGEILAKF